MSLIKSGPGWRLGWDPLAPEFQGLVGGDDWSIELTGAELEEFCRLLGQLATTMSQMAHELMDEEKISCEAESDLMWMQVEGYPHAYSLYLILQSGRRCEVSWPPEAVAGLVPAGQILKVF